MEGMREEVDGPGEARKDRQDVKVSVQRREIFKGASHSRAAVGVLQEVSGGNGAEEGVGGWGGGGVWRHHIPWKSIPQSSQSFHIWNSILTRVEAWSIYHSSCTHCFCVSSDRSSPMMRTAMRSASATDMKRLVNKSGLRCLRRRPTVLCAASNFGHHSRNTRRSSTWWT